MNKLHTADIERAVHAFASLAIFGVCTGEYAETDQGRKVALRYPPGSCEHEEFARNLAARLGIVVNGPLQLSNDLAGAFARLSKGRP